MIRGSLWKRFCFNCRKCHVCKLSSWWGISTNWMSAGKAIAGCKYSWGLLNCTEDNFLAQELGKWTTGGSFLDLELTNTEEFIKECRERLQTFWCVVIMLWQSLWSWRGCVWQKTRTGPWLSGEWPLGCLRNYWMGSSGKLLGDEGANKAGSTLRIPLYFRKAFLELC